MSRQRQGPPVKGIILVALLVWGFHLTYTKTAMKSWKEGTATAIGMEIRRGTRRVMPVPGVSIGKAYVYYPMVTYRFIANHVSYNGYGLLKEFRTQSEAEDFARANYPKGTKLQIRYDPKDPQSSTVNIAGRQVDGTTATSWPIY